MKLFHDYSINIMDDIIEIIASTSKGKCYLMTMEALWIQV